MQFVTLTKEFLHIQSIEKVFLLNSEKGDLFYALCASSLWSHGRRKRLDLIQLFVPNVIKGKWEN